jgi:hypothetical protein
MTTSATAVLQILIVVAVLVLVIRKRLTPRPVRGDTRRWRIPLVLVAIGAYSVVNTTRGAHAAHFTGLDAGYLAIGVLLSLGLGALRGATIKLTESPMGLMQQYTYRTVALWVLIILVRLGMDVAGKSAGVGGAVVGSSILLMFGVSLLGESMAVTARTGVAPSRAY